MLLQCTRPRGPLLVREQRVTGTHKPRGAKDAFVTVFFLRIFHETTNNKKKKHTRKESSVKKSWEKRKSVYKTYSYISIHEIWFCVIVYVLYVHVKARAKKITKKKVLWRIRRKEMRPGVRGL